MFDWGDALLDGCCDKLRLCSLSEKKPVLAIWPLDHVQQISEMEETRPQDRGVPYIDIRYTDTKKYLLKNMKKYEVLRIFLEQMQENTICLVGVRTGGYYSRRTKTRLAERTVFTSFLSVDFVFSISHQEFYTAEQDWCISVSEKNRAGIDTVDHHAHLHPVVKEPPEVWMHSIKPGRHPQFQ